MKQQYSLVSFLLQCQDSGVSIQLETTTGVAYGVVQDIDTQTPFPSVFLKHPKSANGVGITLSNVVTFRVAGSEHQPKNTVPNEDGESVTVV
ncbi:hypothetical protein GCM10010423_65680 [Streptomyces levis]|uniref:Uncharacterized protein n=1 Tax=Streptomyces levis TaxID=285566 RepID=A0ABN3P2N8_9ACTN